MRPSLLSRRQERRAECARDVRRRKACVAECGRRPSKRYATVTVRFHAPARRCLLRSSPPVELAWSDARFALSNGHLFAIRQFGDQCRFRCRPCQQRGASSPCSRSVAVAGASRMRYPSPDRIVTEQAAALKVISLQSHGLSTARATTSCSIARRLESHSVNQQPEPRRKTEVDW